MSKGWQKRKTGFVEKYYLTKPVILYRIPVNTLSIKTFEFKSNFRINLNINGKRVG